MRKLLFLLVCSLPFSVVCGHLAQSLAAETTLLELSALWWAALLISAALVNWSLRRTGPRPWHELG